MGFWNKLGKIALVAAPYVAAPFTGGASLYFTGASNAALKKWNEHDARKAAEKGVAPSKFDRYLGYGADAAGIASGAGAMGKFGSAHYATSGAGGGPQQLTGWQDKLARAGGATSGAMNPNSTMGWQGQLANLATQYAVDRMGNQAQPTTGNQGVSGFQGQLANQAAPRVPAMSAVERGRQDALRNQPFRAGYNTNIQGDEEGQVITTPMPQIYPQYQVPIQSESGGQSQTPVSPFMDNLTPRRMARRRNPIEEEVYD